MLIRGSSLGSVAIGIIIGNFAYQAMTSQLWAIAAERSFFQACAILCVGIVGLFSSESGHDLR